MGDTVLQNKPTHEAIKSLEWIVGTWEATEGKGSFPSIVPFNYCERVQFTSHGQPLFNYGSHSWHPDKKIPMHLESGFLRIKPGTSQVAFMVAHNFGLTSVEEGEITNGKIILTSKDISRMSWAKDPEVTKMWFPPAILPVRDGEAEENHKLHITAMRSFVKVVFIKITVAVEITIVCSEADSFNFADDRDFHCHCDLYENHLDKGSHSSDTIVRHWSLLEGGLLEQVVLMETKKTPLCEHLRVSYRKIES